MATRTSVGTGLWSAAGTWDTGVPVDTDTVVIANTHTVTFDVDQSGFATGITLTVNAGGSLVASTTAGTYYLKLQNTDGTINGIIRAGTDTTTFYPANCTFTIDHNNNAKSLEVSATGHLYLYPSQPTNKYITITEAGGVGEGTAADPLNVDTNVTGDWAVGQTVAIVDSTATDVEYFTISAINAGSIEIGAVGLAAAKSANSLMVLVTRNIRIINVAASDYAVTYANSTTAGNGDYIGAELSQTSKGINLGNGWNFAGTTNPLTTSTSFIVNPVSCTISGCITGNNSATSFVAVSGAFNTTVSGLIAGCYLRGISAGYAVMLTGRVFGSGTGDFGGAGVLSISSTGKIDYCTIGSQDRSNLSCFGNILNCGTSIYRGGRVILGNVTLSGTSYDLRGTNTGAAYNTLFGSATEFYEYSNVERLASDYFESFDHDQVVNAFKAWCLGGIVTSQTVSPPTGYTIFYRHAVETASHPVFRQYAATVQPGTAIEVSAVIRNTDGIDVSATSPIDLRPRLEIIDVFADPLVDSTKTALDSDPIAVSNGTNTDWQAVDVIWANTGDAPRQVYVRIICYSHDTSNHNIDEAWSVADYQDQIADIHKRIRRFSATSEA